VSLLEVQEVTVRFGGHTALSSVSLEVEAGRITGLIGPNGAGKTTMFNVITGMQAPTRGRVVLDGKDIGGRLPYKRARLGIGYLPQEASIFRKLSVEDNLMAVLQMMKLTDAERKNRVEQLLHDFNIGHIRKSKGYMLSGGERRRTEIARALATDPKFILLDEPFAGIDPIAVEEIMKIVATLKHRGIGVLVTDHNVHETLSITDRSYLLFEGRILKAGSAEFLANDPEVRKLYLGENFKLDRYE